MLVDEVTLLKRLKEGDMKVFNTLYREYHGKLCDFARYFLKDSFWADEVVQEVFITVWENRSDIRITSSLQAYLFRCVHNRCINLLKHENVMQHALELYATELEQELMSVGLTDAWFYETFSDLKIKRLKAHIRSFPRQQKEIFLKVRIDGKSYKEVAQELCISVNTVKTQLSRALNKLRKEFCG